ncbi:hypothetical protein ACFS5J_01590 [Flavobacterium chuncheonense]|uniref:Lipoprotein n=1 Tax=Flavobacterium chuncheonense TaxID=2026653 RepID=A0ABW5YI57_9FLAO
MNKVLTYLGFFIIFFSLQFCIKKSDNYISIISVPNDSIRGQAFIGKKNSSVIYTPKGNFIQVIQPDSGIWRNLIIKKSNNEIKSKLFFHDDNVNVSLIYDSLKKGNYELYFISDLKDTISKAINFEKNIELKFPVEINDFYSIRNLKYLNIDKLNKNDTLQLFYKKVGCFNGSLKLIEFINNEQNEFSFRRKNLTFTLEEDSNEPWVYSKSENIKNDLNEFLSTMKNLDVKEINYCSAQIDYIFRIKGEKTIYWGKDNACELIEDTYDFFEFE